MDYVNSQHIQQIIDSFEIYYDQAMKKGTFAPIELKNFMEPIFEKYGYRQNQNIKNLRGGGGSINCL